MPIERQQTFCRICEAHCGLIVDIAEGNQARHQGNVGAGQAIGIARAVEALVVVAGDLDGHLQERRGRRMVLGHFLEHFRADRGVSLHDETFFGIELGRFQEDVVGQADFADVVQGRTASREIDEVIIDLIRAGGTDDQIISWEIEREEVVRARRNFPLFRDRRPDVYGDIAARTEDLLD